MKGGWERLLIISVLAGPPIGYIVLVSAFAIIGVAGALAKGSLEQAYHVLAGLYGGLMSLPLVLPFIYIAGAASALIGAVALIAVFQITEARQTRLLLAIPAGAIATLPTSVILQAGDFYLVVTLGGTGALTGMLCTAWATRTRRPRPDTTGGVA